MKEDNMMFDNNISMIASGYRNNQPVALVERNINDDIYKVENTNVYFIWLLL